MAGPIIKQQQSLLQWLGEKFGPRKEAKTPEQWVQESLATVRQAGQAELAGILMATLFAKKTLDTTRQVDIPFPDTYMAGEKPIDAAAQADLAAYAAALIPFHAALVQNESPVTNAVARGAVIWIATMYSAALPGLLPQGKEIWQKLMTAQDGVDEAYKFYLRREPTDVERTYLGYRPALLLG